MRREHDRYAVGLGLGAAASLLLGVADRTPLRLVAVGAGAVLVTLILAAAAIAGGYLGRRALVSVAGAGFVAAAVLQVVQMSIGETNTLGGDGSTVGLFSGFGIGLLAVGSTRSPNLEEDKDGSQ